MKKALTKLTSTCCAHKASAECPLLRALDMDEEQVLFPFITTAETRAQQGLPMLSAPCGSVCHPIQQMEYEHENAGRALAKLREVTCGYALPPDSCPTFRAMYDELQRMEADLHQHIHLENNILFPHAIELEKR